MSDRIPPHAKRVFEGVLFDVYQWQQEMFDGSKETFEVVQRIATTEILAVVDDQLLVIEDDQPHAGHSLTVPGGMVERGEDPLVSAQRELLEETGYTSKDWELVEAMNFGTKKIDWPTYLYVARNCTKVREPETETAGERIQVNLIPIEDFLSHVASELDMAPFNFFSRSINQKNNHRLRKFFSKNEDSAKASV